MNDFFGVKEVSMTDEKLEEILDIVVESHDLVTKWSENIFGKSNQYRKFRKGFYSGEFTQIPKKDRAIIENLQGVELILLQHHIKACMLLAKRYYRQNNHRMPGVTLEDFGQEAIMAVLESVFGYNGETKFITYVYRAIKNRLNDFVLRDNALSAPSPYIIENAMQVQSEMSQTSCTFDEAIEKLGIDPKQMENCNKVLVSVLSQTSLTDSQQKEISLSEVAVDYRETQKEKAEELLYEALATAPFSDIERKVFQAYLDEPRGFQTRIAKERNVSRAAISLAFIRAKKKLKEHYFLLAPSEAA